MKMNNVNGLLWHRAKANVGSRGSRKRYSKIKNGIRARARVREEYNRLTKGVK